MTWSAPQGQAQLSMSCPDCGKKLPVGAEKCNWCNPGPPRKPLKWYFRCLIAVAGGACSGLVFSICCFFALLLLANLLLNDNNVGWLVMGGGLLVAFVVVPATMVAIGVITSAGLTVACLSAYYVWPRTAVSGKHQLMPGERAVRLWTMASPILLVVDLVGSHDSLVIFVFMVLERFRSFALGIF